MTGRPEIWRWFSLYNTYLPIPKGLEAWSFPYESAILNDNINALSISHMQMVDDDYKLFKRTLEAKNFKILDEIKGKNGVKYIFWKKN